jgi:serine/threonine protein kinase
VNDLLLPARLQAALGDAYVLERELGGGGMSRLFVATERSLNRQVVIKVLPPELASEVSAARFKKEIEVAAQMQHPHIVPILAAGSGDDLLWYVMPYVRGESLRHMLKASGKLPVRDAVRILIEVADALAYAHRQGIVHRDIKPSNILLDKQGKVKVADFGIAKMTGQSTELTVAGSVMGSPQYLSPEQIRGEDLDGRSDIFSLGVVLYELLSQKRPFDGDTITTLVYQILHKEPPPISELRAVPDRLEALLRCMLAKNRDDRFSTAADLSAEVAVCERELSDETLAAPASNLPLQATRVLPKRTTDGVPAQSAPNADPNAAPSASGAPATGTLVPALPPRVPTPPPIPARAAMPPPATAPIVPAVPDSRPGYGKRLAVAILLVLFLMVGVAGAGVWWFFFHRPATQVAEGHGLGVPADQTASQPANQENPSPVSNINTGGGTTAAAGPAASVSPAAGLHDEKPHDRTPPPAVAAPPVPEHRTPGQSPAGQPAAVPIAPGGPQKRGPFVPPSTGSPEPQHPPVPAPSTAPAPEAPPDAPAGRTEPEEEERPARSSNDGPADQTLKTGLALVFRPDPPDAFVLVDGTSIGRATEWNGQKGGRTFTLSGPGEHRIKIRSQGMKDFKIAIQATETGGVTPILSRLRPLPAAQSDASDLKVYRVREAVAFKVEPPGATVLVDGQPAGQAKSFGGRFAQPGTWLKLPPGRHRIGLVASGMARQDFVVEVFEGADKDREKIEATLQPGG